MVNKNNVIILYNICFVKYFLFYKVWKHILSRLSKITNCKIVVGAKRSQIGIKPLYKAWTSFCNKFKTCIHKSIIYFFIGWLIH